MPPLGVPFSGIIIGVDWAEGVPREEKPVAEEGEEAAEGEVDEEEGTRASRYLTIRGCE